jgi:hypothetical protein
MDTLAHLIKTWLKFYQKNKGQLQSIIHPVEDGIFLSIKSGNMSVLNQLQYTGPLIAELKTKAPGLGSKGGFVVL